jgi:hypothetical protein
MEAEIHAFAAFLEFISTNQVRGQEKSSSAVLECVSGAVLVALDRNRGKGGPLRVVRLLMKLSSIQRLEDLK